MTLFTTFSCSSLNAKALSSDRETVRCGNVFELDSNGKSPSSNLQETCNSQSLLFLVIEDNTIDRILHLKLVILALVNCVTRNV